jgi:ATP-dependent RNA/DNA helicase IGHMBP2
MKNDKDIELILDQLEDEWVKEHAVEKAQFEAQRNETTLAQRIELGYALKGLGIEEVLRIDEKQSIVWFSGVFPHLRLTAGSPVEIIQQGENGAISTKIEGYLTKNQQMKIGVMIEYEEAESLENHWILEERAQNSSFEKGLLAIQALKLPQCQEFAKVLLGIKTSANQSGNLMPTQVNQLKDMVHWQELSQSLNEPQQAITLKILQSAYLSSPPQALPEIHLIHGPPGTGKSHTLIQLIMGLVDLGKKILFCAPSNQAVDHLCIELYKKGLNPIRWGHLSRINPEAEQCTLKYKLQKEERAKLAYEWLRKAKELRDRCQARKDRHRGDFDEMKLMYQEARALTMDAKKQLKIVKDYLLDKSPVICATAVGTTDESIKNLPFDVLIIDEAAQLISPLALTALTKIDQNEKSKTSKIDAQLKSRLVVFAGDHQQIGPTILNPSETQTTLLRESLFERLMHVPQISAQMLEIEYRFNQTINTFPSQMHYHQRLIPSPQHLNISLLDFPQLLPDEEYQNHALVLIDCAAKGWQEQNDQKSIGNIEMAELTAKQVKKLIDRGVKQDQIIVITPYARQVQNLKELLKEELLQGLEIGTVDAFQGREAEVVFVDLVRMNDDHEIGFLKEIRRMNVALTRAKRLLVVIADSATIGQHKYYQALLDTVDRVGLYLSAWDILH